MRKRYFLCTFLFFLFQISRAQFSKSYNPSKWTTANTAGSNGSVNSAAAPGSITLTGSNDPTGTNRTTQDVDYTIVAIASGVWSFDWVYNSNDSFKDPSYDQAGVLVNGDFTQLSDDFGGINQSGTYSISVSAGDIIGFRVRATDNIEGDATFAISNFFPPGGVLPVKLSAFTAKHQGTKVLLQWTSETEVNASHIEVERSFNGLDFSSIGRVAASALSRNYSLVDEAPLAGINYYRLRMVDLDGSFSYSTILPVETASNVNVQAYPNPASDYLMLRVRAEKAGSETIQLYNSAGTLLKAEPVSLSQGVNLKRLSLATLPQGIYFLKAELEGWKLVIVKQ